MKSAIAMPSLLANFVAGCPGGLSLTNGRSGVLLMVVDNFPAGLAVTDPFFTATSWGQSPGEGICPQGGPGSPKAGIPTRGREPTRSRLTGRPYGREVCLPARDVPGQARAPAYASMG